MRRKKIKKGPLVTTLDQMANCEWVIIGNKPYCRGWVQSWQFRMAYSYIRRRMAYEGIRVTNREYYEGKSDESLTDKLGERLCDYCPLPDELKGVHCYGGEPVMCEGIRCNEALDRWLDEEVE